MSLLVIFAIFSRSIFVSSVRLAEDESIKFDISCILSFNSAIDDAAVSAIVKIEMFSSLKYDNIFLISVHLL